MPADYTPRGLPSDLLEEIKTTLKKSELFDEQRNIKTIFESEKRLNPFHDQIPDGGNTEERISNIIAFAHGKGIEINGEQQNVFQIFLAELVKQKPEGSALREELALLAAKFLDFLEHPERFSPEVTPIIPSAPRSEPQSSLIDRFRSLPDSTLYLAGGIVLFVFLAMCGLLAIYVSGNQIVITSAPRAVLQNNQPRIQAAGSVNPNEVVELVLESEVIAATRSDENGNFAFDVDLSGFGFTGGEVLEGGIVTSNDRERFTVTIPHR
ncbi:MAG: hypothetical protein AAF633_15900 [Chloroflexota bacterium]